MSKRNVQIQTLTPKYDPREDRIRISINYDSFENRIDFMITRSFILMMYSRFDEYVAKVYKTHLPTAPQSKEQMIQTISNASKTDTTNLELYKQNDELLVTIEFSFIAKNEQTLLKFISDQSEATMVLDKKQLQNIFMLIKSSIPFVAWGISSHI